ncbi:hypothetical protein K435DRAFT_113385 [Dendrothele bispora CBS 962.96]|uniref:Uncharacterized protein n=2 Tax=Dendrothele bispora (strain CBS 962.96) TaxID=1314807 RepID=A0A4S8M1S8_DENBC|nr:hypothetical protein K435DRAFT_113385 [Dendrothele bispora CBS 962.96]
MSRLLGRRLPLLLGTHWQMQLELGLQSTGSQGTWRDTAGAGVAVVGEVGEPGGKKKKVTKNVNHERLLHYSTCTSYYHEQPCQRCNKRKTGHLRHDEQTPEPDKSQTQQQRQSLPTQMRLVGGTSSSLASNARTQPLSRFQEYGVPSNKRKTGHLRHDEQKPEPDESQTQQQRQSLSTQMRLVGGTSSSLASSTRTQPGSRFQEYSVQSFEEY